MVMAMVVPLNVWVTFVMIGVRHIWL